MTRTGVKAMYIYVSGPYSPTPEDIAGGREAMAIEENVSGANSVGLELARRGHYPLVPHTMMKGWEDVHKLPRTDALRICHEWVRRCDALFFIAESEGAESERQVAAELGLPIYRHLDDVGEATAPLPGLSERAVEIYLKEYEECAESYRHTYTTIWQACALLSASGAALLAFGDNAAIQAVAPLPLLVWYLGLFLPMDRYAEDRSERLRYLEGVLSKSDPDVSMSHFSSFDEERKKRMGPWERVKGRLWRVKHVVFITAILLLIAQGALLWKIPLIKQFFVNLVTF